MQTKAVQFFCAYSVWTKMFMRVAILADYGAEIMIKVHGVYAEW